LIPIKKPDIDLYDETEQLIPVVKAEIPLYNPKE